MFFYKYLILFVILSYIFKSVSELRTYAYIVWKILSGIIDTIWVPSIMN
mgnify:CR=1 FL=1